MHYSEIILSLTSFSDLCVGKHIFIPVHLKSSVLEEILFSHVLTEKEFTRPAYVRRRQISTVFLPPREVIVQQWRLDLITQILTLFTFQLLRQNSFANKNMILTSTSLQTPHLIIEAELHIIKTINLIS